MPVSVNKKTDGGDAVVKAEALDNEEDSPIVSRTRSGLRLRTPAAKTPVRRTRKPVVREIRQKAPSLVRNHQPVNVQQILKPIRAVQRQNQCVQMYLHQQMSVKSQI